MSFPVEFKDTFMGLSHRKGAPIYKRTYSEEPAIKPLPRRPTEEVRKENRLYLARLLVALDAA